MVSKMNKNNIFIGVIAFLIIILCIFIILIVFKLNNTSPNNIVVVQTFNEATGDNGSKEISGEFFTNISFINDEKIITTASIDIGNNNMYELDNFIDGI